jgi:hypothetical protein
VIPQLPIQWWIKKWASHSSRRKKLGHTQQQGKGIWTHFLKRRIRMRQCQCIWPSDWEIGLIKPLRDSLSGKADATNSNRPLGRHENIKHGGTANGFERTARLIVRLYVWDGLA